MGPFCGRVGPLLFCLVLLTACSVRDRSYNPVHFQPSGTLVPPDLVFSGPSVAPGRLRDGLYVQHAVPNDVSLCCWVAGHARFRVRKTIASTSLSLTSYVPDIPLFQKQSQQITVTFPGFSRPHRVSNLGPGFHTVLIPVPKVLQRKTGAVLVQLDCALSFVAAERPYSVELLGAYFV